MKYDKNIDGVFGLKITDNNFATVTGDVDQPVVEVQLANNEEADKMIAEFEDPDGELIQMEDSIFHKYPELAPFIP